MVVLLTALVLGACTSMPVRSGVENVEEAEDLSGSTARYAPAPPSPGSSPQQVVRGYLDAMLAYPVSRGVAAQFLTPRAEQSWRPSDRTEIYTEPHAGTPREGEDHGVEVTLTRQVDAVLDPQGRRTPKDARESTTLELERVAGEWRISNPPSGLMVNEKFAADYIRPFSIYFFDASGANLVPDLVHLVVGDTLPTSLVLSLARGPAEESGSVRTHLPPAADLRPSVPVSPDGVADVELSEETESLDGPAAQRMSAQLVWTLRQLDDITGVRVLGTTALRLPGGDSVQSVDAWSRYEPRASDGGPWVVRDGALAELRDGSVRPVDGPWAEDAQGVSRVSVWDGRVAVLLPDDNTVRVADRQGEERLDVAGASVSDLSWSHDGTLLVLDRPGGAPRVRIVDEGDVDVVQTQGLGDALAVRLSPEGGRYVALSGDRLLVGAVVRDDNGDVVRLDRPREVPISQESLRSPVWIDGTRLAFLAETDIGQQVHSVNIDGSDLQGGRAGGVALPQGAQARELVVDGGSRPGHWVLDADGSVWFLPRGGGWSSVDDATFTALGSPG